MIAVTGAAAGREVVHERETLVPPSDTVREILGRPPRTLADVLREHPETMAHLRR